MRKPEAAGAPGFLLRGESRIRTAASRATYKIGAGRCLIIEK